MGILKRIFGKKPDQNGHNRKTSITAEEPQETAQAVSPNTMDAKGGADGQKERTPDERLSMVLEKTIEIMKAHAPNGPFHVAFDIPESQNEGHLVFRLLRPNDWQLQIGANREGSDMLVSYFLCHGDRETVLAYLSKPGLKEELVRSIKTLSESVDDRL